MNSLTRRRVIVAAISAASLMSSHFRRVFGGTPHEDSAVDRLVRTFKRYRFSAIVVGREYLRCAPGAANETRLFSMICSVHGVPPLISYGDHAIQEWIRVKSRDDFREGRVVEVDGWMLSATEARLCALVALS